MPDQMKGRNKQLDLMKILATFAVIRLHSGVCGFADRIILYMCGFAVPIFFMVSGALILGRSDKISNKYVFTRSCRILKLIIIWGLLLLIPISIINREIPNLVIFFTSSVFQTKPLWQFWFLWALLFLTLCSPFVGKILQSKRSTKIYITILFFINGMISLFCIYEGSTDRSNMESLIPQSMRMWSHLLYYSLGGILIRYCQFDRIKNCIQKNSRFILLGMLAFSVGIASIQYCICMVTNETSPEYCFSNPIVVLYNILLFVCIFNLKNYKIFESGIFKALCFDSLGIYIVHPYLTSVLRMAGIWSEKYCVQNFVSVCLLCLPLIDVMRRIPYIRGMIKL